MADLLTERARDILDRLHADDARQRAEGLPSWQRTRNLDRESGRFLALAVLATGAKEVVEIGSSNGVSTIWLASGAAHTGGRVTGTELMPERATDANRNLAEAGFADIARVLPGDARESLAALPGPFDLAFIDAEKDDYPSHLLAIVDKLRPGGLVLADNVLSHDISAYQRLVRERDDLAAVTLPLDRGIEWVVKLG